MTSPKYNRTLHLPWSLGATSDDKIAKDVSSLLNRPIIITEKIDGSNTSLEKNGCFARTHSGPPSHASFDGLKALHGNLRYLLPEDLQFFGEWTYALHSIAYDKLPSYFLLFNVRELKTNTWSSWDMVQEWANELQIPTVPVLYSGTIKTEKDLQEVTESLSSQPSCYGETREGIVIRVQEEFNDTDFSNSVMKWVRKNHVTTDDHWSHNEIVVNKLRF